MRSEKTLGAHLERFSSTIIYTLLWWLFLFFLPIILLLDFPDRLLEQVAEALYLIAGIVILWKTGLFKHPFRRLIEVEVYEHGLSYQRFETKSHWEWQDFDFFTSKAEYLYHPRIKFEQQSDGSYGIKKLPFDVNHQLKLYIHGNIVFILPFVGNRERLCTVILE